ncbi:SAM-dependent methyltransferase [Sphaerisporangium sp. TRM90804]|uniref:SAM-dependent methyltransferase n=1 Tax=Sphaerisporangium sp. TRM90804 TaxID=3031113 RepID=UPI002446CC49|nr:SAM-dependent methyltransferase [Sphaerisporangium sp. TRM90804]MDH2426848.1 SAM-dependent methyltransferase [Sphaerisporangium sp. TRM90804]
MGEHENGDRPPAGVDVERASIARAYDALLGGTDHFAVDRAAVAELRKVCPEITDVAVHNRRALGRGVRHLAGELGIRQFLDLGSGLPTAQNTHQVAQSLVPDARVVYVDIDPMVPAHSRALLPDDGSTAVIAADLREPETILGHPDLHKIIDFEEPVAVLLVAILHHLHDDEDPRGIVEAYLGAVPPGSPLFVTHFCSSSPDAPALEKAFHGVLGTGRFRSMEEIRAYFDGTDLQPPGVVYLPDLYPEVPRIRDFTVAGRLMAGGIGVRR